MSLQVLLKTEFRSPMPVPVSHDCLVTPLGFSTDRM